MLSKHDKNTLSSSQFNNAISVIPSVLDFINAKQGNVFLSTGGDKICYKLPEKVLDSSSPFYPLLLSFKVRTDFLDRLQTSVNVSFDILLSYSQNPT